MKNLLDDDLAKQDEALVKSFILNEADSAKEDKPLCDFYMWQHQISNHVRVNPIPKKNPLIAKSISEFIDLYGAPQINHCYGNALRLSQCSLPSKTPINYIEGYCLVNGRILTPHAWNEYAGNYFDITMEQIYSSYLDKKDWRVFYLKIINLDPIQAGHKIEFTKNLGQFLEGLLKAWYRSTRKGS